MTDQSQPPFFAERATTAAVSDLAAPLSSGAGWMKFVGIMFIVQGAMTALSLVGIIIAWIPIWIGVLVMQSAGAIERAQATGDAAALRDALGKLRTYFVIQGVFYLIGLVLAAVAFVFWGAVFLAMFRGGFPTH
jgi:hypothetical protein